MIMFTFDSCFAFSEFDDDTHGRFFLALDA